MSERASERAARVCRRRGTGEGNGPLAGGVGEVILGVVDQVAHRHERRGLGGAGPQLHHERERNWLERLKSSLSWLTGAHFNPSVFERARGPDFFWAHPVYSCPHMHELYSIWQEHVGSIGRRPLLGVFDGNSHHCSTSSSRVRDQEAASSYYASPLAALARIRAAGAEAAAQ